MSSKFLVQKIHMTSGEIIEGPDLILTAIMDMPEKGEKPSTTRSTRSPRLPISPKKGHLELRLYQLHRSGKGTIPEGFDDVYLCDLLEPV